MLQVLQHPRTRWRCSLSAGAAAGTSQLSWAVCLCPTPGLIQKTSQKDPSRPELGWLIKTQAGNKVRFAPAFPCQSGSKDKNNLFSRLGFVQAEFFKETVPGGRNLQRIPYLTAFLPSWAEISRGRGRMEREISTSRSSTRILEAIWLSSSNPGN